jgi:hypothetical protein
VSRPSTGTGTSADTVPTNTVPTDTVSTPRTGAATRPGSPPRGESAARPAPTAADPAIRRGPAFPAAPPVNRMRRARLKIANVDPWSVMKVSFLFSVAIAVMGLVAVTLLWALLDMMGVFSTVGNTIDDVTGGPASGGFDVQAFFSLSRVLGFTTIIALVDIVLLTALATVGAYLYNVTTDFVGGIEITLAEEE